MACFFPSAISAKIHPDCFSAQILLSKIIRIALGTLRLLWIEWCEIVHCSFDGETNVNDVLNLRVEVSEILNDTDYFLLLPSVMVNINPAAMDASELRTWLLETYSICNDKDAYAALNDKVKTSYTFTQSPLRD